MYVCLYVPKSSLADEVNIMRTMNKYEPATCCYDVCDYNEMF